MKYCIDPSVDEPIMLIDKHIGNDEEDGEGILGSEFCKELLFLDTLNKKCIQIWINSPGGLVDEGMQIYYTILKTKTKVNTYNMFMAASIAAPIFLAGRNRCMANNSNIMIHDPFVPGDDLNEKQKKALEQFRKSIVTTIATRSKGHLSETEVAKLMEKETWFDANEALNMGLCDEVENLSEYNAPKVKVSNAKDYKIYSSVLNKIIEEKKQKNQMIKVANKLNLNPAASEDAIVEAINAIQIEVKDKSDKADAIKKKMDELMDKHNDLKKQYDDLKKEADDKAKAEADDKAKAEADDKKAKAKVLVQDGVKAGKIKNDATLIASYEKLAETDFETTKNTIESLPVSKNGAKLLEPEDITGKTVQNEDNRPNIDISNPKSFTAVMNALKLKQNNKQ